jgi:outer membrane protein TolC
MGVIQREGDGKDPWGGQQAITMMSAAKMSSTPPRNWSYVAKRQLGALILLALPAGGCANLEPDQGMSKIESLASARFGEQAVKIRATDDAARVRDRLKALLANPLTAESAVQIAILNNRGLQAAFYGLGVSEAQLSAAVLPPSPTLSNAMLSAPGALEIEWQIAVDLLAVLSLPQRREIAENRFKAAQFRTMLELLHLVRETQRAFIRAVAASQTVDFLSQARAAAEASAEIAQKLGESGGMNRLDQARTDVAYAELSAQLAAARLAQNATRERLTRLLGLWGSDIQYRLPGQLKALPSKPRTYDSVEGVAVRSRIDLAMLRTEIEAQTKVIDLAEATRFINLLEVGVRDNRQSDVLNAAGTTISDNNHRHGYDVAFEIPIFDLNQTRLRSEREAYMQLVNRLIDRAVQVRSEARAAYVSHRGSYDIAGYYRDHVRPLRKIIVDENQLHYNGMLLDLFQFLADARANVTSNIASIDALRNFWLADADLQAALFGGGAGNEPKLTAAAVAGGDDTE